MYCISMATSTLSLMIVEATKKLVLLTDIYWTNDFHHFEEIINNLQHPLPEDWMVLSTVRLTWVLWDGWVNWEKTLLE